MFLHLSVFLFMGGVCQTPPLGRHLLGRPHRAHTLPPQGRQPLQQMERILLECILGFFNFGEHIFLWGHWYPCSRLLWCLLWVSKPEWTVRFTLSGGAHDACSLWLTSGATPADLLVVSVAAEPFQSTYVQTTIGGAPDWDLSSSASQCDTKQTFCRLSYAGSAGFTKGRILNGFGFRFWVPVAGFSDQVNLKCILKACVCAIFL